MRRLAILGALALALTVAAPVFAASHTTGPGSTHPATAASKTLRATAASGRTDFTSRVVLASNGKSGTFWLSVKGEAPKSRETSVLDIGACGATGDTAVISVARATAASGTWSGTAKLTSAEIARVMAALKAHRPITAAVTDGKVRLCGTFSG
jgi:hypothetical protein